MLSNLAQVFGLLDSVKNTLDKRRHQTDPGQEEVLSTLTSEYRTQTRVLYIDHVYVHKLFRFLPLIQKKTIYLLSCFTWRMKKEYSSNISVYIQLCMLQLTSKCPYDRYNNKHI